jgi:hypothetical protein
MVGCIWDGSPFKTEKLAVSGNCREGTLRGAALLRCWRKIENKLLKIIYRGYVLYGFNC